MAVFRRASGAMRPQRRKSAYPTAAPMVSPSRSLTSATRPGLTRLENFLQHADAVGAGGCASDRPRPGESSAAAQAPHHEGEAHDQQRDQDQRLRHVAGWRTHRPIRCAGPGDVRTVADAVAAAASPMSALLLVLVCCPVSGIR
jgi:hypothetical protein